MATISFKRARRGPYRKKRKETVQEDSGNSTLEPNEMDQMMMAQDYAIEIPQSDPHLSHQAEPLTLSHLSAPECRETENKSPDLNIFMMMTMPNDSSCCESVQGTAEDEIHEKGEDFNYEKACHQEFKQQCGQTEQETEEEKDCDLTLCPDDDIHCFEDLFTEDIDSTEDENLCFTDVIPEESINNEIPLYEGAGITVGAAMLLLAIFATKHNLVGDSMQQLLQIIAFLLPNGHKLCTSLHSFKSFFRNLKTPMKYHYYCPFCLGGLSDNTKLQCPNDFCSKSFEKIKIPYFLEMPVVDQLKSFFSQEGFFESLKHRFERHSLSGKIGDIYDGNLYKKYVENSGPLSKQENVSFTLNTDGAPVFKSSKMSIWPIFLVINELPFKIRVKKENMILGGLWFGSQKPAMGTFLKPLYETMAILQNGIELQSPRRRGNFICRAFLLCATADLPARSLLCNSIQYNGAYGCWKCFQSGETAKIGKGHTHVFPFNEISPKGPERTSDLVLNDAKTVVYNQSIGSKNIIINGVKGPTWLSFFPMFNIVKGIAIDYMHGVLLGVQKLLLRLWFSNEFSGKKFNFHIKVSEVDKRLLSILPTLEISRLPRSIYTDLKHWKAAEYRSFLLYYGAPVLSGILDDARFNHYLLLVNALHILLSNGCSLQDIQEAEIMLLQFCKHFENLYDKCYMTLNIHQLVHLADSVRELGPLYTHSCFHFEDKIGFLLKMIGGTNTIDNQIITGVSFVQKLPELKQECIIKGSEAERLYNLIESPSILKRCEQLEEGVYVLGSFHCQILKEDEFNSLTIFLGSCPQTNLVNAFNRLQLRDCLVYGNNYKRMAKRNNSTIKYTVNRKICFGHVRFFFTCTSTDAENQNGVFAFVETLQCPNYNEKLNILSVEKTVDVEVVPVSCMLTGCMFVEFPATKYAYICLYPNSLESD